MASKVSQDSMECWCRRQRSISSIFFHFTFMLIYILAAARAHLEGDDWRGGREGGADDVWGTITGRGGGVGGTDLQYLLWKWSSPTEILFQLFFSNHPPPVKLILLPGPSLATTLCSCNLDNFRYLMKRWWLLFWSLQLHKYQYLIKYWRSNKIWQNTSPSRPQMRDLSRATTVSVL